MNIKICFIRTILGVFQSRSDTSILKHLPYNPYKLWIADTLGDSGTHDLFCYDIYNASFYSLYDISVFVN